MGQNARKHGGLIIHILVAMFTFIGLAIVCDEYFVSSLDRICEGKSVKSINFNKNNNFTTIIIPLFIILTYQIHF